MSFRTILVKDNLLEMISEYYALPGNEAGGPCHIVLDDFNVRDRNLEFCLKACKEENDLMGIAIIENLMLLETKVDRWRAIGLDEDRIKELLED